MRLDDAFDPAEPLCGLCGEQEAARDCVDARGIPLCSACFLRDWTIDEERQPDAAPPSAPAPFLRPFDFRGFANEILGGAR